MIFLNSLFRFSTFLLLIMTLKCIGLIYLVEIASYKIILKLRTKKTPTISLAFSRKSIILDGGASIGCTELVLS